MGNPLKILSLFGVLLTVHFSAPSTLADPPNPDTPSAPAQEAEPVVDDTFIPIPYRDIPNNQLLARWRRLLPVIENLNKPRSDAIIRILSQELNAKLERPIQSDPTPGKSKDDYKFDRVKADVSKWLKDYSEYDYEMRKMRSALDAIEKHRIVLEDLLAYFQVSESNGYNLFGEVQGIEFDRTLKVRPTLILSLPPRPTQYSKAVIRTGSRIDYQPRADEEMVSIPSNLDNSKAVLRTLKSEAKDAEVIKALVHDRMEMQAILYWRLERLHRKNLNPKSKIIDSPEILGGVIQLEDMSDTKTISALSEKVGRNLDRLFRPGFATRRLQPDANAMKSIDLARSLDAEAKNRIALNGVRNCRTAIQALGRGAQKGYQWFKSTAELASTPAKVAIIASGFTAMAGAGTWLYTHAAHSEAERKAAERVDNIQKDLDDLITTAKDPRDFDDRFLDFAQKFWIDEGVGFFYDYRNKVRTLDSKGKIVPEPKELGSLHPISGRVIEEFMFDHANQVLGSYNEAWSQVAKRLDGRAANRQKQRKARLEVEKNGLEKSFTPPPPSPAETKDSVPMNIPVAPSKVTPIPQTSPPKNP